MAGFSVVKRGVDERHPRSVAAFRDWLSIKDFGATGNGTGVGDDAAFAAALAAQFAFRSATGGLKPILVPPGNYHLNPSMQMFDGMTLIGQARDWFGRRTIIQNIHNTMFTYPAGNVTDLLLENIAFWGDGAKTLNCFDPQNPTNGFIMAYGKISNCAFQFFLHPLDIRATGTEMELLNIGNTANVPLALGGFDNELARLFINSNVGTLTQVKFTGVLTTHMRRCFITAPNGGPALTVSGGEGCEFAGNNYDGFNNSVFEIAGSGIQFSGGAQGHRVIGGRLNGAVQSPTGFDQGAILFNTASNISVLGLEFANCGPSGTAPTLAFNGTNDQINVAGSTYVTAKPSVVSSSAAALPTNFIWDEQTVKNATRQLPGLVVPQDPQTGPSTLALGNTARFLRVVPPRDINVISITVQLSTAAGSGTDGIDVGIYDSTFTKIVTNGGTTGLLNVAAPAIVTVPITSTLKSGQVYYVGLSATSGTTAQILGTTFQNVTGSNLFGSTPPNMLFGTKAAAFPLPAGTVTSDASSASMPLMALRET